MSGVHFLDARGPDGVLIHAIGDVHGRLDLLKAMHGRIAETIEARKPRDWRIVHLGDYVDRGLDSNGVLAFLTDLAAKDSRVISLPGNHDLGLLDFLDSADPAGLFANYGGYQTALSYGVGLDLSSPRSARQSRDALAEAIPAAHLRFLGTLPRSLTLGDFFFCHAGVRPGIPLDKQDEDDLISIRWEFLDHPGLFEKVVVHGHTPAAEPEVMANRVNVDTGAFRSGRLSALVIDGEEKALADVSAGADQLWAAPTP